MWSLPLLEALPDGSYESFGRQQLWAIFIMRWISVRV